MWMSLRTFRPFVERGYTIWCVNRRQGTPEGHSIGDMADDYADLIEAEFGGRVDVVLGVSHGGLVGFHLAARNPECFGRVALGMAAYEVSERGKRIDYEFADPLQAAWPCCRTGQYRLPRLGAEPAGLGQGTEQMVHAGALGDGQGPVQRH